MQIDIRYHKKFIESGKWADAEENILYGAKLLRENLDYFKGDEFPAIASYNCSRARVANFVNMCWPDKTARNILIDRLTTGQNYASDVLERAEKFRLATQKAFPTT
jgi:soluble lytic murein transglycosylase-like protein